MTMYYKALTGSRLYHSNTESSDIDIIVISNKPKSTFKNSDTEDIIIHSPQQFIDYIFDKPTVSYVRKMALFSKPLVETDFSNYLIADREDLMKSNLRRYGDIHLNYAKDMICQSNNEFWRRFPKRIIIAMRSLNEYINYASKDISFEESLKQSDELVEFIKGIKLRTIPYETQMEKLNSMLAEADSLKEFYNKKPDLVTFERIKNEMKELLDLN